MLPVGVVGRNKYPAYATIIIIAMNVIVFIWELSVNAKGPAALQAAFNAYAFNVCEVGVEPLPNLMLDSIRSMFLHGSFAHLFGNMLFLWVFGRKVEEYFGSARYLVFYMTVGLLATLAHVVFGGIVCATPAQKAIVIGASGAIAGVMGSFLFLYPTSKVDTVIGLFSPLFWRTKLPAFFYLLYWFILDFLQGIGWIFSAGVAHWAHIGGFVSGMLIVFLTTMLFKPAPKPDPFEYLDE